MRFLCINPNTNAAMTEAVVGALRPFLPHGAALVPITARSGVPVIASRASFLIGGCAALAEFALHADDPVDGVLMLCFGDPALAAMREVSAVPVIGMAEASMRLAARQTGRFSIVTGGAAWEPMLTEFAASLGLADRLASVRTTTATGADIFRDPDAGTASLVPAIESCRADGAERVILGGAGLAGLATRLRPLTSMPILDCVEALALMALELVASDRARGLMQRASPHAVRLLQTGCFPAG